MYADSQNSAAPLVLHAFLTHNSFWTSDSKSKALGKLQLIFKELLTDGFNPLKTLVFYWNHSHVREFMYAFWLH